MLSTHGPPTRELSFPAVPAGRESPHPIEEVTVISAIETMDIALVIG
jgi:hypothetical protein